MGGYHIACFLAQQVAEKALKAYLYGQGEDVVPGRSVERLCQAAAVYDPAFTEKGASWSVLDGYYVPTRYPNTLPDSIPARVYTQHAAREAVAMATEVVDFVEQRLPGVGEIVAKPGAQRTAWRSMHSQLGSQFAMPMTQLRPPGAEGREGAVRHA